MRAAVIGATGTLGGCLVQALRRHGFACETPDRRSLDLGDPSSIRSWRSQLRADIVFNCAAYNAVDHAESQAAVCNSINAVAPGLLAETVAMRGGVLVHVSTDYVFGGTARTPYGEDAPTEPLGVYGKSKLQGEGAALAAIERVGRGRLYIVRTSWVFGPAGKDFVGLVAARLRAGETVRMVHDQRSRPTYAPDLAEAMLELCGAAGTPPGPPSVYHFANRGEASRYDMSAAVAAACGIDARRVQPIASADYASVARRPVYSALSTTLYEHVTGKKPRDWREALNECLDPGRR